MKFAGFFPCKEGGELGTTLSPGQRRRPRRLGQPQYHTLGALSYHPAPGGLRLGSCEMGPWAPRG